MSIPLRWRLLSLSDSNERALVLSSPASRSPFVQKGGSPMDLEFFIEPIGISISLDLGLWIVFLSKVAKLPAIKQKITALVKARLFFIIANC